VTTRTHFARACWCWLAAAVFAALCAWLTGGERENVAAATALALAPALAGFIFLPRLGEWRVDMGLIAIWLLTATGLIAGCGGAASPLASALAIAPAMALALGRAWVLEVGACAVLAYALAAYLAGVDGAPARALGAYPALMSVVALSFSAGLLALARQPSRDAAIAELSHELRTPLTHILGFSEMIERKMFGEIAERYVEYAGLIRQSGAHLLSLVNDLLDLSKIGAGRYELELATFDARAILTEVVALSRDSAGRKSIALDMLAPDGPLPVRADSSALRRMLFNIVGNAVKYTPHAGRITVSAISKSGALVIDVADNGPGIPAAERAVLGQAYHRGSAANLAEGTGLGLALVRALAALHGGKLSFHDAPGGGALVRISLPVVVKEPPIPG
jgi:signal transduction histidine kinase